jgi:hypothetical protein
MHKALRGTINMHTMMIDLMGEILNTTIENIITTDGHTMIANIMAIGDINVAIISSALTSTAIAILNIAVIQTTTTVGIDFAPV